MEGSHTARGQAQAADAQRQTTNALGAGQQKQAAALEGQLIPEYTSLLNTGYTPTEESAMTTAGMGGVASSYGASQQEASNAAARTNNPASEAALQDKLALEKGQAMGNEAANLQTNFANEREKNRTMGLEGLQGLYGSNQQAGLGYYGMAPGLLQARAAGGKSGVNFGIGPGGPSFGVSA